MRAQQDVGDVSSTLIPRSQILAALEEYIRQQHITQSAAAIAWNVSPSFVTAVLKGRSPPTKQMLTEIGYERIVAYAPILKGALQ